MKGLWRFGLMLGRRLGRDDIAAYAAALAYNLLFALFPLILAVTAMVPAQVRVSIMAPLATVVTPEVIALLQRTAGSAAIHPTLAYAGVLGYVWGMSGAFRRLIDAFNHAYEFPRPLRRKGWQTFLLSVGLALTLGVLLVAAMGMATFGRYLLALLPGPRVGWLRADVVLGLRWVVLLAMALVMLSVLYGVAPDRPRGLRLLSPGAAAAILAWLVISLGFSQYLTHFNSYNLLYGSVGAVILLLLYLYFLSYALLLGAELDAVLALPHDPHDPQDPGIR